MWPIFHPLPPPPDSPTSLFLYFYLSPFLPLHFCFSPCGAVPVGAADGFGASVVGAIDWSGASLGAVDGFGASVVGAIDCSGASLGAVDGFGASVVGAIDCSGASLGAVDGFGASVVGASDGFGGSVFASDGFWVGGAVVPLLLGSEKKSD